jgi:PhnB protein
MAEFKGVIPHLMFQNGAAAAIEYYKAALGAVEEFRMPHGDDGRLLHASLKIGDQPLMLADEFPEFCGEASPLPIGRSVVTLHLCVADCDAQIAQAVGAGAKVTMPAMDAFWGDRYGKVTDPFGHEWSFSTPLSAERHAAAQKEWEQWQAQQKAA